MKNTLSFILQICLAIILALAVRTFVVEPFRIPSGSMIPTLQVGDYIIVTKYSYGYSKASFPFDAFNLFEGRFWASLPRVGDVVVFREPAHPNTYFVKRVIGLPGDKIQVLNSQLYINGTLIPRVYVNSYEAYPSDGQLPFLAQEYIETLPNGHKHYILQQNNLQPPNPADNTQVFVVPQGTFFVMGDDRDDSEDSRFAEVGYIPLQNLVGRARYVVASMDFEYYPAWEFWEWPWEIRWHRFFLKIQ